MGHGDGEPLLSQKGFRSNHNGTVWERLVSDGGLDKYVLRVSVYPFTKSTGEAGPSFEAAVINPLIRNEDRTELGRHEESVRVYLGELFEIGAVKSSKQEALSDLKAQF